MWLMDQTRLKLAQLMWLGPDTSSCYHFRTDQDSSRKMFTTKDSGLLKFGQVSSLVLSRVGWLPETARKNISMQKLKTHRHQDEMFI